MKLPRKLKKRVKQDIIEHYIGDYRFYSNKPKDIKLLLNLPGFIKYGGKYQYNFNLKYIGDL